MMMDRKYITVAGMFLYRKFYRALNLSCPNLVDSMPKKSGTRITKKVPRSALNRSCGRQPIRRVDTWTYLNTSML